VPHRVCWSIGEFGCGIMGLLALEYDPEPFARVQISGFMEPSPPDRMRACLCMVEGTGLDALAPIVAMLTLLKFS